MSTTETLTCEFDGHTWQRPQTRGRKPHYCNEHRPTTEATYQKRESNLYQEVDNSNRATEIVDRLESNLKARGTHISQQPEYGRTYSIAELVKRIETLEREVEKLKERME